jgi:hypothetical protein
MISTVYEFIVKYGPLDLSGKSGIYVMHARKPDAIFIGKSDNLQIQSKYLMAIQRQAMQKMHIQEHLLQIRRKKENWYWMCFAQNAAML